MSGDIQRHGMKPDTPRFVAHDDRTWRVTDTLTIDDELFYDLMTQGPTSRASVVARMSECVVVHQNRVRKFRDGGIVLEMNTRGQCFVRKAGSRKRYETSLEAIFSMTVKAHVAMQKSLKAAARRAKRGK
jgi:hypothetical protein